MFIKMDVNWSTSHHVVSLFFVIYTPPISFAAVQLSVHFSFIHDAHAAATALFGFFRPPPSPSSSYKAARCVSFSVCASVWLSYITGLPTNRLQLNNTHSCSRLHSLQQRITNSLSRQLNWCHVLWREEEAVGGLPADGVCVCGCV